MLHRSQPSMESNEALASAAVLFELDDTLIDLQHARRHGLRAVQELMPELEDLPLEELELVHDAELTTNYQETLDDSLSEEEANREHMRGICRRYGLPTGRVADAAHAYESALQSNWRLVPGVDEMLETLRTCTKVGVVTNGRSQNQWNKLEFFDLLPMDTVVVSADVGVTKPHPDIFEHAINDLGVEKVTMIGDSWEHDVLGALASGMDAIWLNRYQRPCPDQSLVVEIDGFKPVSKVLNALEISPYKNRS